MPFDNLNNRTRKLAWHEIHFYRPPVRNENFNQLFSLLTLLRDSYENSNDTSSMHFLPKEIIDATTLSQKHVNMPRTVNRKWAERDTSELRYLLSEAAPESAYTDLSLRPLGFVALNNIRNGTFSLAVDFGTDNPIAFEHHTFIEEVSEISGFFVMKSDFPSKVTLAKTKTPISNKALSIISEGLPETISFKPTVFN